MNNKIGLCFENKKLTSYFIIHLCFEKHTVCKRKWWSTSRDIHCNRIPTWDYVRIKTLICNCNVLCKGNSRKRRSFNAHVLTGREVGSTTTLEWFIWKYVNKINLRNNIPNGLIVYRIIHEKRVPKGSW